MIRLHHIPGPPLSEFVEVIWLYEGYALPHALERILPMGTLELVLNLHEDRGRIYDPADPTRFEDFGGASVTGAYSEHFVIDTAEQWSVLGAHFRPGGAFPFFGLPIGELQDRTVRLEDLWGVGAIHLRDEILEAGEPEARIRILERALLARARSLSRHPAVAFAVRELRDALRPRPVASVSDQIGFSQRHFIQLFRQEVGLTPKLFSRIQRFQAALRGLGGRRQVDWTEIALSCGFFDQAHFIRDFRAFSGLSPTAYLAQRTEHMNHVPLTG